MLRRVLWRDLVTKVGSFATRSWIIFGDFNVSRFPHEHSGGRPVVSRVMKEFEECIQACEIEDLRQLSRLFTWSNKGGRRGKRNELVTKKLDRVLGNWHCFNTLSHLQAHFLEPGISDHSPVVLQLQEVKSPIGRQFKYLNVWGSYLKFASVVQKAWQADLQSMHGSPLETVSYKLKLLKSLLRDLHWRYFNDIPSAAAHKRRVIEEIQNQLDSDPRNPELRDKDREVTAEVREAYNLEEAIYR
ncbi:hypothetical protein CFOL_v3_24203 [Cephalotus follicularis]|uniref:Exo_endo_phos domain-containing protein n=1 Tax=Cephalotus follicularis TaxID=3775 RepID=A0A1Q3CKX3_CEPFO|nr:hypothetical protein CFOL_v3_24203 [Cephalotus follicularis]